jgi:hypothetical protein
MPMTWSFLSRKNLSQKKKILRENSNEDAVHQHGERHELHKTLKTKELGLKISFNCFF